MNTQRSQSGLISWTKVQIWDDAGTEVIDKEKRTRLLRGFRETHNRRPLLSKPSRV